MQERNKRRPAAAKFEDGQIEAGCTVCMPIIIIIIKYLKINQNYVAIVSTHQNIVKAEAKFNEMSRDKPQRNSKIAK